MKSTRILIFLSLLFYSCLSQAVIIDGREWRQVTDTIGFSWNQISSVCSPTSGVCNGNVGAVSFNSWTWAQIDDVAGLFSYFNPNFMGPLDNISGIRNSIWAPQIFEYFEPTLPPLGSVNRIDGLSRTLSGPPYGPVPTFESAYFGWVIDRIDPRGFDSMTTIFDTELDSRSDFVGHWFYRDVVSVPEPSTYLLMGLGLLGIAFKRKRILS